jgi:hypothetical protein
MERGCPIVDDHLQQPVLLRFLEGRLDEFEVEEAFGHLAHCDGCRTRLEALRGLAREREPIFGALFSTLPEPDPVAAGAAPRGVWATLRIVLDRARGVGGVTASDLKVLASGRFGYRVTPVIRAAGVGDVKGLGRGAPGEVNVEVQVVGPAIGSATVIADAARGAIAVLLQPPEGVSAAGLMEERAPRASLFDARGRRCREERFLPVRGAAYLLAEFEHLEDGHWTLALEFDR